MKKRRITALSFHPNPHADEALALVLMRLFGEELFPGVKDAEWVFTTSGGSTPDGRSAEAWERDGTLFIGTGGGWADDHRDGEERSCCEIIADALGISERPELQAVLGRVSHVDRKGDDDPLGLGNILKALYSHTYQGSPANTDVDILLCATMALSAHITWEVNGSQPPQDAHRQEFASKVRTWLEEKTDGHKVTASKQILRHVSDVEQRNSVQELTLFPLWYVLRSVEGDDFAEDWLDMALAAKYDEQRRLGEAISEVPQKITVREVRQKGGSVRVGFIRSDNDQMHTALFFLKQLNLNLIVLFRSNGHVQIMRRQNKGSLVTNNTMREIARVLRVMEQVKGGGVKVSDFRTLESCNFVDEIERWYLHESGNFLLNGANSAPEVTPTLLSEEEIRRALQIALDQTLFEEERAEQCQMGECTHTERNPCPWHCLGLRRCRKIRHKKRQQVTVGKT
ncbi:MAG: hypothetical protein WD049_05650 [Candidatus Paceibacterota bacterium]